MKKLLASTLFSVFALPAFAVDTCSGESSVGNPLPCCTPNGNCTWWAWKKAKEANWPAIPIRNANLWDDTARDNPKLYNVSTVPTVGAVGVKESSPYTCNGIKNGCDTGHVAYITGLIKDKAGKITDVTTSEMSCGKVGLYTMSRPATWFDTYITPKDLNGQMASSAGCTDGTSVANTTDKAGNKVNLFWSKSCQANWAQIIPKVSTSLTTATITRTATGKSYSSNAIGTALSPMVIGMTEACASAKVSAVSVGTVCK